MSVNELGVDDGDLGGFRRRTSEFLDSALNDDVACPAFGAIMPPRFHQRALAWQRHCHRNGFAGLHWPVEYGGQGLTPAHTMVWNTECARRRIAPYMNFQGFVLAAGAMLRFGTEAQKQRFLPSTLTGEILWCQLFSEPGAGSDLASLTTRAVPTADSGGWRVTGQKVWSSTAQLAQWAILLARSEPDVAGHRGISFFLLDMGVEGVTVRPIKQMTGDDEFCEVFLDAAPLGADALIGERGAGWAVANSVLADERSAATAAGVQLRGELGDFAAASTADAGGSGPAAPKTADAGRVVELVAEGRALAHLLDRSAGDAALGPLTKLARSELGVRLTAAKLETHGMAGVAAPVGDETTAGDLEAFLYAPGLRFGGGTSEIQRNLIGERLLGLPREPRPRRD